LTVIGDGCSQASRGGLNLNLNLKKVIGGWWLVQLNLNLNLNLIKVVGGWWLVQLNLNLNLNLIKVVGGWRILITHNLIPHTSHLAPLIK